MRRQPEPMMQWKPAPQSSFTVHSLIVVESVAAVLIMLAALWLN